MNAAPRTEPIPIHSGMRVRRFKTPDWNDAVPDLLHMPDGTFVVNPEWEKAEYEEEFFDKNKQPLKAKTMYGVFRELHERGEWPND